MNFWTIFLCLLFGAVIGFEFGKYVMGRKIQEAMNKLSEQFKQAAEDLKKKAEVEAELKKERAENLRQLMSDILPKVTNKEQFVQDMGIEENQSEEIKDDGKGA